MWRGLPAGEADMSALAAEHIGDGPSKSYGSLAAATLAAWEGEGVVDNPVTFPGRELPGRFAARMLAGDVLIHGWDLARATDQTIRWDQDLAADVLEWHREAVQVFPPELRAQGFAPEVPALPGADTMTQLVAFVGRHP
jgi:uncharacterized protein (TIGR03086 family)